MMKKNDLVGQEFSRLTVLGIYNRNKKQSLVWLCSCECGGYMRATAYELRSGRIKSCKCLLRSGMRITHGMGRGGSKRSKIYNIWASMLQRCTNPKDASWHNYGGRGVAITPGWRTFEGFYGDMGDKPIGKTLERINNDGGYNKANCIWADMYQQGRNRRNNVWVVIDGERMILVDACRHIGADRSNIHKLMKQLNVTPQEAIDSWLKRKRKL